MMMNIPVPNSGQECCLEERQDEEERDRQDDKASTTCESPPQTTTGLPPTDDLFPPTRNLFDTNLKERAATSNMSGQDSPERLHINAENDNGDNGESPPTNKRRDRPPPTNNNGIVSHTNERDSSNNHVSIRHDSPSPPHSDEQDGVDRRWCETPETTRG